MKISLLVMVLAEAVHQVGVYCQMRTGEWGYGDGNGPHTWQHTFPTCGGRRQSPVAINYSDTEADLQLTPFHFFGYDAKPTTVTLTNTGNTAQVNMDIHASVSGGSLVGEFVFHQLHFHWGAVNTRGSEHTLNDVRFPAELHLVHYRKSYGSFKEAAKHDDGVAVFGVMLQLSNTDNPNLHPVISGLKSVIWPLNSTTLTSPLVLHGLLPSNVNLFFSYSGSLTTPGCDEIVQWTIFNDKIPISSSQLKRFRQLIAEDGSIMQDNFRTLQPLYDREVRRSWL